ncbi:MAG TPA: aldehyde dehydrogenase [Draconibacterium sp.]|nr:aldehyde dehydrogenase [Draconibacterium sp.]
MDEEYILKAQTEFFNSHITLETDIRLKHLKNLKQIIKKSEKQIVDALLSDLGKGSFEAYSSEIGLVQHELTTHIRNLKRWARPKRVRTPLHAFPSLSFVTRQPYGRVLIISPFNYPFMLALAPLVGAVSAGNVVVIKPSELTPKTSEIIAEIIRQVFEPKYIAVVQGGVEASRKLLAQKWDKIFFTGSSRVGKIVMEAATRHVTPVVLELGGKNPVVVDKDANLKIAARRIVWGKLLNAGQSCVAPDYLYVHNEVKEQFLQLMVNSIKQFFSDPHNNRDYTGIVNEAAVRRLAGLLNDVTVYYGGQSNTEKRFMGPTLLTNVTRDSAVMQEEIFGPVLPVIGFNELSEVVDEINNSEKPLAAYYFSENRINQKFFLRFTFSGDAMINDVVLHFTNHTLPFGGVGNSGIGSYHGKRSFDVFSHERSVMKTSTKLDIPLRYPPYKKWISKLIRFLLR